MTAHQVHYVFRDNKTFAIREGKVIAVSTDPDDVERQVKANYGEYLEHGGGGGDPDKGYEGEYGPQLGGPGESQSCPGCGAPNGGTPFCPECGSRLGHGDIQGGQGMENPYPHDEPSPGIEMGGEAGPYVASVVTPNGLKGTVLGKVASLWGDEVTVRLENGRIVKLPVGTELHTQKTAAQARVTPIERLEARLALTPDGTRESLVTRSEELGRIKHHASRLVRDGVSHADSVRLDQLVVTAEVEQREITDAVAHLDAADPIAPPSFTMSAAHEAAGISREDASWLDYTVDEMIKEAEATDFTKLMDEGPEALTAELADAALADAEVTQQIASSFVSEKTAGIDRKIADPYVVTFLARVAACREDELSNRSQPIQKEAAAEEDKYKDLPDEAFFI